MTLHHLARQKQAEGKIRSGTVYPDYLTVCMRVEVVIINDVTIINQTIPLICESHQPAAHLNITL